MRIACLSLCLTNVALCVSLTGCGSEAPEMSTTKVTGAPSPLAPGAEYADDAANAHPTQGPQGGHLIELGDEEYHAELLHDESTHTVTIHLLDGPAKQTVAVPLAELTLQLFGDGQFAKYALKAVHEPNDPPGMASRFEIVNDVLCDALCHEDEIRGRLQVTIDGKPYIGSIEHIGHEGQSHAGHPKSAQD